MTSERTMLPEYAHPPLVAATLGVSFSKQTWCDITPSLLEHFQQRLGAEWIGQWGYVEGSELNHETDFGLINWGHELRNILGDRIIRLGAHHFGFTWFGTDHARYPRYENLRDGFVAAWDLWTEIQPEFERTPAYWGVRYLNHIPQGTVWHSPRDWAFFRLLSGVADLAERVTSVRTSLKVPDLPNELDVNWTFDNGSNDSSTPCIWFRLTAKGPAEHDVTSILDGMDAGRAAIVQTFGDLMSPAANAYWGLRRREK